MFERGAAASAVAPDLLGFVRDFAFKQLPDDVIRQAKRCLLDLIGVAAAGSRTAASSIVNSYAAAHLAGRDRESRILFDGRRASAAGAAFAGATTIDAMDAHDGHALTKGHAGVAVLPAVLAYVDQGAECDGREFIVCLVLGYEIATRAGIALHASVSDYHCSGAWNALACAAIGSRLLDLDREHMRHALGIAEYFGPRGQILRVCSEPSMLKDGSGWGAHAGVTAALLARDGFTGAPAVTVEHADVQPLWRDLGTRWQILEQYFKAYPVCRWAQPAIEAVYALKRAHRFDADSIAGIVIESFREAIDLGSQCEHPTTTEQAQYSLPFAVAAAVAFEHIGADEVDASGLSDARVKRLLGVIELVEDAEFSRRFPAERWARVRISLADDRILVSEPARARGNPENPLSDGELHDKYHALAEPALGQQRAARIATLVGSLAGDSNVLPALMNEVLNAA
jgi:2-methylcitrate dehydratase PrpD